MSCAIFTVLSVLAALSKDSSKVVVFGTATLAVTSILVAAFRVWKSEDDTRLMAQAEFAHKVPAFVLAATGATWEFHAEAREMMFFVAVALLNQGEASVALGWHGTFKIGLVSEPMNLRWIFGEHVLGIGTKAVRLTNDDLIGAKTKTTRVESGGMAEGRLRLTLPGDRSTQVAARNFSIGIGCRDATFKQCLAFFCSSPGEDAELRYNHSERVEYIRPLL